MVVYSRPSCAPCVSLKRWLAHKGVSFEEVDIDTHPQRIQEIIKLTGFLQVPTVVTERGAVSGLNLQAIAKLL